MFETMTSAFVDEFPGFLKNKKVRFTAFVCFIEFLLGIPCVLEGGMYILQIMDWYCATFSLMLLSLTECVVIGWVYGRYNRGIITLVLRDLLPHVTITDGVCRHRLGLWYVVWNLEYWYDV